LNITDFSKKDGQSKPSSKVEDNKPPQSLKDIFKISNRNRKKNKQKKKVCKFDSEQLSTNSSESLPVDNVNQIIAMQYKIDQQEGRGASPSGITL